MAAVMIGVDPHKGSHTAVVIGAAEEPLGELRVRASQAQAGRLVAWAAAWPERTWAAGGARGLGPLAQQLVAAGERVRTRPEAGVPQVLLAGKADVTERPETRVAVAALRPRHVREVAADDTRWC